MMMSLSLSVSLEEMGREHDGSNNGVVLAGEVVHLLLLEVRVAVTTSSVGHKGRVLVIVALSLDLHSRQLGEVGQGRGGLGVVGQGGRGELGDGNAPLL